MMPHHAAVLALAAAAGVAFAATTADAEGRRSIKDAPAPSSWTGFYAGVHAGYGFSSDSAALSGDPGVISFQIGDSIPPSLRPDLNGVLGGLQLGRNWQFGAVVVGIEVDFSGSAIGGSAAEQRTALDVVPIVTKLERDVDWLSTVRGRIGLLPAENLLIFPTGGLAFGRVEQRLSLDGGGIWFLGAGAESLTCPAGGALCLAGSSSDISVGWTAGAGF